jgi:hypothetical protein
LLAFSGVQCKIKISLDAPQGNLHRKEKKAMLFSPKEKGQGLVEYALMILGPIIGNVFSKINSSLSGV